MPQKICLDIGGTKIAGALVKNGKIFHYQETKTLAKKNNEIILNNIINFIDQIKICSKAKNITSINIGLAGHVDFKKGILISSPNFNKKFKNINLAKIIQTKFKLPIYTDNDANCFVLGEKYYGQGKKHKNIVGITLGTGVGGGIIINNKIYRGKNNLAGEIGQLCFNKKSIIKNLPLCLFNVLHYFDPEIIIIGGGLSHSPGLISASRQIVKKLIYYQSIKNTPIIKSKLQNQANLLGAYSLK